MHVGLALFLVFAVLFYYDPQFILTSCLPFAVHGLWVLFKHVSPMISKFRIEGTIKKPEGLAAQKRADEAKAQVAKESEGPKVLKVPVVLKESKVPKVPEVLEESKVPEVPNVPTTIEEDRDPIESVRNNPIFKKAYEDTLRSLVNYDARRSSVAPVIPDDGRNEFSRPQFNFGAASARGGNSLRGSAFRSGGDFSFNGASARGTGDFSFSGASARGAAFGSDSGNEFRFGMMPSSGNVAPRGPPSAFRFGMDVPTP